MRALVKTQKGKGYVELRDVPVPSIGDDEVLIEVKACGTDLHIYHNEFPYDPPVILGHQFSGTIAAVGKRVEGRGPRGRGAAHEGLRDLLPLQDREQADLSAEAFPRVGNRRRVCVPDAMAGACPSPSHP
jgi:NADPH:quinone reductase-like Zn-dependent oxidoreductase